MVKGHDPVSRGGGHEGSVSVETLLVSVQDEDNLKLFPRPYIYTDYVKVTNRINTCICNLHLYGAMDHAKLTTVLSTRPTGAVLGQEKTGQTQKTAA